LVPYFVSCILIFVLWLGASKGGNGPVLSGPMWDIPSDASLWLTWFRTKYKYCINFQSYLGSQRESRVCRQNSGSGPSLCSNYRWRWNSLRFPGWIRRWLHPPKQWTARETNLFMTPSTEKRFSVCDLQWGHLFIVKISVLVFPHKDGCTVIRLRFFLTW
jgi:hypothetical protein